jgi:hypothetical protein
LHLPLHLRPTNDWKSLTINQGFPACANRHPTRSSHSSAYNFFSVEPTGPAVWLPHGHNYMMPTPIYCKLHSLSTLHHLSRKLYTLPYERGTAAKLERIFRPSDNIPKHRPTHASQSSNYATGLCSMQRISRFMSSTHNWGLFQIHPTPGISQNDIVVPPPAAHPTYYEPHREGYARHYGSIPPVSLFT